jgi:hypothetical protein
LGDQIEKKNRLAGHVAHRGRGEAYKEFWWGNPRERDHLENPGLNKRIILKWIFSTWDGAWTGLIWLRIRTDGGLL